MTTSHKAHVAAAVLALAVPFGVTSCGGGTSKDTSPQAKAFCVVSGPVKALAGVLEVEP